MNVHTTSSDRSLQIELHAQVLGSVAALEGPALANWGVARPAVPAAVSICVNLFGWTDKLADAAVSS